MIYISLDVTSEAAWNQAIDKGLGAFGHLDVLFNNAGVALPAKIEDMTEDTWDRELNIHAKGVFLGTKAVIPVMRKGGFPILAKTRSV